MRIFRLDAISSIGLTGGFDFSLDFIAQIPGMTAEVAAAMDLQDQEPGLPIVTSLREQLGLRVVPAMEQAEILVIEHAERPSAN